ncbi:MAG TPA: hypothetical protein VMT88_13565, partial [Actinomycetes bacterium]|nr:hypothetical protein [Actinomycetes bacterium]
VIPLIGLAFSKLSDFRVMTTVCIAATMLGATFSLFALTAFSVDQPAAPDWDSTRPRPACVEHSGGTNTCPGG